MPFPSAVERAKAQAELKGLNVAEQYRKATDLARQDWEAGQRSPFWYELGDHFCRKYQSPANDLFVLNELSRLVFQEVWIVHDASLGREVPRLPQHLSIRFLKKNEN